MMRSVRDDLDAMLWWICSGLEGNVPYVTSILKHQMTRKLLADQISSH